MITVHTRPDCKWCLKAKKLLSAYNIPFNEIRYETEEDRNVFKANIAQTFPQIFNGNKLIGGYMSLEKWMMETYIKDTIQG